LIGIKIFKNVSSWTYHRNFIAHNGVFCGHGRFLMSFSSLPGIILLKDRYRPILGMSRNEVREMSFAVLCDMVAVWSILHEQGYLDICDSIKVAKP